jgi:hypothetical protein
MGKKLNKTNERNWKIVSITLLVISLCLLFFYVSSLFTQSGNFPSEKNQWCSEENDYYIVTIDGMFRDIEGCVETTKELGLISLEEIYDYDDPPIEVYANLYIWEYTEWIFESYIDFPAYFYGEGYIPIIPLTYNDYSITEDLIYESLENTIEYLEDYEVLNFSISHKEQMVTMTKECHESMTFYNSSNEYIVEGYYYGVQYELECYLINETSNYIIYIDIQVISECNSGIPLFQSMILATYHNGWIYSTVFGLKTIVTSIELQNV